MTLPEIKDPGEADVGGWILHAQSKGSSYTHRAGALTAARENLGPKWFSVMLRKMKLETAEDVVEWLAGK
jgi:hypothetical protein